MENVVTRRISIRLQSRLYGFANLIARLVDFLVLPFALILGIGLLMLVATIGLPVIWDFMNKVGLPGLDLPEGLYPDLASTHLETVKRVSVLVPVLAVLAFRDRLVFPIRYGVVWLLALILAIPGVFWTIGVVKALSESTSAFNAILLTTAQQYRLVQGLFSNFTDTALPPQVEFPLQLGWLCLVLSAFVYLIAAFSRWLGVSRVSRASKKKSGLSNLPGMGSILPRFLPRLLGRYLPSLLRGLLCVLISVIAGGSIILSARLLMDPSTAFFEWSAVRIAETFYFSSPLPPERLGVLPDLLWMLSLATLTFLTGVWVSDWRRFWLWAVLSLAVGALSIAWLLHQSDNILFMGTMFGGVPVAVIAIIPWLSAAYRLVKRAFGLAWIDAVKSLHDKDGGYALLLRPFALDAVRLHNPFRLGGYFRLITTAPIRLEEIIAKGLYRYAPLYAVGDPKEKHPSLGGMRDYFQDDAWMEYVSNSIGSASIIVFIIDESKWTTWETKAILGESALDRVVFVVPPKPDAVKNYLNANPEVAEILGINTTVVSALYREGLLMFTRNGKSGSIQVVSSSRTTLDYSIALDQIIACRNIL